MRVLLCDDNAINQKVALRLLQQMGYRADLAANGLEALAALDKQPYDLIFMDVMMPEMGGLEATAAIRQRQQQQAQFPNYKSPIIIVAMTASAMPGDREKCIASGMDDYLAKPVRLEDMRTIVERWGVRAAMGQASRPALRERPALEPINAGGTPAARGGTPAPLQEIDDGPASGNGCSNSHITSGPAATPDATAAEVECVDMERLLDFTEGNPESFRELATLYLTQTSEQLGQLEAAVKADETQEVRRIAHSCAGASATCGMRRLVPLLRELERQGQEEKLSNAGQICQQVVHEFDSVRVFLEAQLAKDAELAAKT